MAHWLLSNSGDQSFLLPLCYVHDIAVCPPLAESRPERRLIRSWMEAHGCRTPILNNAVWLGKDEAAQTGDARPARYLIRFMLYGRLTGIAIDQPGRIVSIPDEHLQPAPPQLSAAHGLLACWTDADGRVHPLLDIHRLVRTQLPWNGNPPGPFRDKASLFIIVAPAERHGLAAAIDLLRQSASSCVCLEPDQAVPEGNPSAVVIRFVGTVGRTGELSDKPPRPQADQITLASAGSEPDRAFQRIRQYRQGIDQFWEDSDAGRQALGQALACSLFLREP